MVKHNYTRKIKELRKKKKINVIFLVTENAKWNGDSLYKKLTSNTLFYPKILVIINEDINPESDINYLFFKQRGYKVFAIKNIEDFRSHEPDMVFWQQPWFARGRKNPFSPYSVSKYALCLHFPYGIVTPTENNWFWNVCHFFFATLYKQFLFNSDCVKEYEKRGVYNTIATGHPMLDVYAEPIKNNPWHDSSKIKIIYAPHHSFEEEKGVRWATFDWNGKQILQMAKDNPHTEWIFKPHPHFKREAINNGIFTTQEVDEYYNEWTHIGQVYDMGDYYDIFRTSNLLITDCGGFLIEYLPTDNPVIHLIPENEGKRSPATNKCSQHYYKVYNLTELESTFDMLVNQHNDPLRAERQKDAAGITFNAADNIMNELMNILDIK